MYFNKMASENIDINDVKVNNNNINIKAELLNEENAETESSLNNSIKSNNFIKELIQKQISTVSLSKKLSYGDLKRISKFLSSSIFDEEKCSIWNGYITNKTKKSKGIYINFYFNHKKIALHRLLYLNYIGDILNTEYIKYTCENKGRCCNINHMKKHTYNHINLNNVPQEETPNTSVHISHNNKNLSIEI